MKAIIITSEKCEPCKEMKEKFADFIASGEIEEKKLEDNAEEVAALMEKYQLNMPGFAVIADNGELILSI